MALTVQRHHVGGMRSKYGAQIVRPLVSIIIVVFRDREELGQLIDSIIPHANQNLEIVVIDGASDDGSLELLQELDHQIDYWLSEPDTGIYDAMNKGLRAATGEYVLHLNAGDRLRMVPWEALRQHAKEKVDVVCCRVLIDDKIEFVSRTSLLSRIDNTWHHQGTFYRREAHLGYDVTYHICGDFDHNQRILKADCASKNNPSIVASHRSDGISMANNAREEIYRSVQTNYGRHYLLMAMLRFRLMALRRWIRSTIKPTK
jgi:glycosyltransferase involved in cell wall biosynthesis